MSLLSSFAQQSPILMQQSPSSSPVQLPTRPPAFRSPSCPPSIRLLPKEVPDSFKEGSDFDDALSSLLGDLEDVPGVMGEGSCVGDDSLPAMQQYSTKLSLPFIEQPSAEQLSCTSAPSMLPSMQDPGEGSRPGKLPLQKLPLGEGSLPGTLPIQKLPPGEGSLPRILPLQNDSVSNTVPANVAPINKKMWRQSFKIILNFVIEKVLGYLQ